TPAWTQPLANPLVEIGYAKHPVARLAQHKKHSSSNYIMNLVEAACRVRYGLSYGMQQFIIYRIFAARQAAPAEILFTRLAQGYIEDGGGFSHALAGRSNHLALSISALDEQSYHEFVVDKTPIVATMEREIKFVQERTRKRKLIKSILSARAALADVEAKRAVIAEEMAFHTDSLRKKQIADIKNMRKQIEALKRGDEIMEDVAEKFGLMGVDS
ncbi:MAG: hypothetical protein Q9187_006555, partial [Circinaria calcarea]